MAFFAVERRAGEDVLRLPVPTTYPSRDAVVQALGELLASGAIPAGSDLYVVDLEAAVPVLVLPGAVLPDAVDLEAPAAVPVAPIVEEAAVEDVGMLDASGAADVYAAWPQGADLSTGDEGAETPVGQDTTAIDWQGSLQDALKRAASSLESEGIVPPVPVEAERPHAQVAEPMGVATEVEADAGEATDEAAWPWTNVEAVAGEDVAEEAPAEDDSIASEPAVSTEENADDDQAEEIPSVEELLAEIDEDEPVALTYREPGADLPAYEQPARVESTLIHTAPAEGEDAFLPSPVILGDYGDSETDGDASEAEVAAEVAALIGAGGEDEAGLEYVAPGETHVPEALEEVLESDVAEQGDGPEEEPLEEATAPDAQVEGYAADGGLDMSEYTCNDCVYANTCPKVGQVTPAECVSFQWKSS